MSTKLSEKYLATMLEGYENGITGVDKYIEETTQQLENAKKQRQEMLDSIAELKECLGLDDEETTPEVAEAQVS